MTVLEPVIDWLITTKKRKVTFDQICEGVNRERKPVLRVMDRLVKEGYAEETDPGKTALSLGEVGPLRRNPTWKILKKPLADRPKHQPKARNVRDLIWSAIRIKRCFTRKEIKFVTGVTVGSLENYTKLLLYHGKIRQTGKVGREKLFVLVGKPGPTRPILKEIPKEMEDA